MVMNARLNYMAKNKTQSSFHKPVPHLFGFGAIFIFALIVLFFVMQMVMNKDTSLDTRSQAGVETQLKGDNLRNALLIELSNDKDIQVGGEED